MEIYDYFANFLFGNIIIILDLLRYQCYNEYNHYHKLTSGSLFYLNNKNIQIERVIMHDLIEHRVIKLELRVQDHAEELKKLQDISTDLRNSLSGIEKSLNQIKYLAMGAVLVVLTQSMGITSVLKLIVGL